jgi:phosphoribosylamine--glycine ligase
VVGLGDDVRAAAAQAYAGVEQVKFEGMQFRRDIGYRAMK